MLPSNAAPGRIRILLVDDHVVVRQGLRMLLETHEDLTVVGEAAAPREALEIARRERPAIVLLDLALQGDSGLDIIPELAAIGSGVRVLVLTGVRDAEQHRQAVRAGASGIVLKDQASELLVKAVRRVDAGEIWVDRGTTTRMMRELRHDNGPAAPDSRPADVGALTAREREIVGLVSQGCGTQKIAATLSITEKTVRNHLASIYGKLDVSDRLELALYALKYGLATSATDSKAP